MSDNYRILLTIDAEDWFQVENFNQCIPFSSWPSCELRVEANTHRLLDLLDSHQSAVSSHQSAINKASKDRPVPDPRKPIQDIGSELSAINHKHSLSAETPVASYPSGSINGSDSLRRRRIELSQFHLETEKKSVKSCKSCLTAVSPKATFFVLGWIAERLPNLVREIHARGHEVASHGYYHNLCNQQSRDALKKDLSDSKKLLEDIIGSPVFRYRAPSFAINADILKLIEDCGYLYDSSYNSFSMHGRYGRVDLSQNGARGIALQIVDPRSQTNLTDSTSLRQRRIDFSAFHLERQKPKDTKSEKSLPR